MWLPKLTSYLVGVCFLTLCPEFISALYSQLGSLPDSVTSLTSSLNTTNISSTLSSLDPTRFTSLLNTTSQSLANLTQLLNTTDITSLTNLLNATATNASSISAVLNGTEQAKFLALLNTTMSNLQNLTSMLNSSTLPPLNTILSADALSKLNLTLLNGTDLTKLASLVNSTVASLNLSTSLNGFLSSTSLNDTIRALASLVNTQGLALTDAAFSSNGVNCNCSVNSKTVTEKINMLRDIILPEKINNTLNNYSAILVQAFGPDFNLSRAIMSAYPGASFVNLSYNASLDMDWTTKMNTTARNFIGQENLVFVNQTITAAVKRIQDLIAKTSNHFGIVLGNNNPWLTMRYPGQVIGTPPSTYPWSWICNCSAGFMSYIKATTLSTAGSSNIADQMKASLAHSAWNSSFAKVEYSGNSSNPLVELAVYFNNFSANLLSFPSSFLATNLSSMSLNLTCYKEYNVTDVEAVLKDVQANTNCTPIAIPLVSTSTTFSPSTIRPSLTTNNISNIASTSGTGGLTSNSGVNSTGNTGNLTANSTSNSPSSTTNSVSNSSGNSPSNLTSNSSSNSVSTSTTNSTARATSNSAGNSTASSLIGNNGTTGPASATTGKNNGSNTATTIPTSTKVTSPGLKLLKYTIPSNPTAMPFTDFMLTITIPAIAVLVLVTVGCMCCLQSDCGRKNAVPSA